jgi:hypothetical protein
MTTIIIIRTITPIVKLELNPVIRAAVNKVTTVLLGL